MTTEVGAKVGRFGVRAQALACFLCVMASAVAWSVTTPPFQAPDEPLHLAYVQKLAETGRPPDPSDSSRPALSSEGARALDAVNFSGVIGNPLAKPPWTEADQRRAESLLVGPPRQDDGGGSAAYSNYPPAYYLLAAVPYLVAQATGASLIDTLAAVRLVSCLLSALTAVFVMLFVRELLPGTPRAWLPAALACGLLPYFGFIGSSVNPDVLLATVCAALFFVLARSFRRGLNARRAAALAALLVLGAASKPSFAGLLPGVAVGILLLLAVAWRRSGSAPWRELAVFIATGLVAGGLYLAVNVGLWGRPVLPVAVGVGSSAASDPARRSISGFLSYAFQFWLPRPWFLQDQIKGGGYQLYETIFKGFIGRFGWLDYQLPERVYTSVIAVWSVLLALAGRALWVSRLLLRRRAGEFLVYSLMLAGLLLVIAVPAYDYRLTTGFAFEQARYLFPVMALLGGLYGLAIRGGGHKFGGYVAVLLVAATSALDLLGLLVTVARYYA